LQNIRIITLCYLLCAGVFFSADAQVTTFQKLYGTPLNEYLFDLVEYSQGGYVATGVQYQGLQNGDIYILRTDANGSQLWAKTYSDSMFQQSLGIREGDGGDLIISGTTRSSTGTGRIFVLKTDSAGSEKWMKTYSFVNDAQCNTLEKTPGGFIIGGSTFSSATFSNDACLVKIDSSGTILWNKTYNIGGTHEIVEAVKTLPGGSILFSGYSMTSNPSAVPGFLAKTDSMGNLQWWHFYTNGRNVIHDFDVLTDGSVMLCGEGGNFQMLLLKADTSGNLQWGKSYGATTPDGFFNARTLADGNILLSGASFIVAGSNIGYDMALIKSDPSGSIIWTRNIGGNNNDQCYGLIICNDGGYALCGQTDLNSSSLTIPGIPRLVKTDNNGFSGCQETIRSYVSSTLVMNDSAVAVTSSSNFTSAAITMLSNNSGTDSALCITTGIGDEEYPGETIIVYPNPVEDFLHIDDPSFGENPGLEIYDAFGKKVFAFRMSRQRTNSFNVSLLLPGIYFLKIQNSKASFCSKIVKL
jgi:type IX secretion system substrate protein